MDITKVPRTQRDREQPLFKKRPRPKAGAPVRASTPEETPPAETAAVSERHVDVTA